MKALLDRFKRNKISSAQIAKERLQIIVAHERTRNNVGFRGDIDLHALQQKLIDVIADALKMERDKVRDQITVQFERDQDKSILELNVTLPDGA